MSQTTPTISDCIGLAVLVLGPVLFVAACNAPDSSSQGDASFYRVVMEDGQIKAVERDTIPGVARPRGTFTRKPSPWYQQGAPARPPDLLPQKIDTTLQQWIKLFPDKDTTVLIALYDSLRLLPFPSPSPEKPRKVALAEAKEIVLNYKIRRAAQYKVLLQELRQRDAVVADTFWIVSAVTARIRLKELLTLAEMDEVMSIDTPFPLVIAGLPDSSSGGTESADVASSDALTPVQDVATVQDGRRLIGSDPYFDLGLKDSLGVASTRIGLLDTGVWATHVLFDEPHRYLGRLVDCVESPCETKDQGGDPFDNCGGGHGTSTAAILIGNDDLGDAFRGVTADTLDSFKVYDCSGGTVPFTHPDRAATVRGFQDAVAGLDKVIVAQLQLPLNYHHVISSVANNAFDAGAVIIAATGDIGPEQSNVASPAMAQKVIGAGAFDAQADTTYNSQGKGPTYDGRVKPDVEGPTNTETAYNTSDIALGSFSGTSGSTPYVAGAAVLLRNWLLYTAGVTSIDPGHVYAQLILAGQNLSPFYHTTGAGPLRLPPLDGLAWWGEVAIDSAGTVIDIPLQIDAGVYDTLDAALWWPEDVFQFHNDIDLLLIDPDGAVQDSSTSILSVFERARVKGPLASGRWALRIQGYTVPQGPQNVYWAAHARRKKGSQ